MKTALRMTLVVISTPLMIGGFIAGFCKQGIEDGLHIFDVFYTWTVTDKPKEPETAGDVYR